MTGSPRSAVSLLQLARRASPDPFDDRVTGAPPTVCWLYGSSQYELGTLERLVAEGFAANRHVDYPLNFARPVTISRYRFAPGKPDARLRLRTPGHLAAAVGGQLVDARPDEDGWWLIDVPDGGSWADVEITTERGPAALGLPGELVDDAKRWSVWSADVGWVRPDPRMGGLVPPHAAGEPVQALLAHRNRDGLYALPAPALGHVVLESRDEPEWCPGESAAEAMADGTGETRLDLDLIGPRAWRTRHQLGLRYVSLRSAHPAKVVVEASVRPVPRRGAFVCADEELNRIWGVSAYTLRLCMQRLMIDGIKRDRMPWSGDQAISTWANAYAFGDTTIARDSAVASGRLRHGYVNGISDYSLWWVINHGFLQRYLGGNNELTGRQTAEVHRFLADLRRYAGDDGLFRPRTEPDGFHHARTGSVFLDWGVTVEPGRDLTALQMLWVWALRSAADLLGGTGHQQEALAWARLAEQATETLCERGWDGTAGAWREYLHPGSRTDSAYPNFLSVLSGVSAQVIGLGLQDAIEHGEVGTPFMSAFALRALGLIGRRQAAIRRIRARWGTMLDAGALTFWEEFGPTEQDQHAMYGRPFGKSLCHAWSAGPAGLLPELVLGVRPLTDGWRSFQVDPELGDLEWAGAVVPVPGAGNIVVTADQADVSAEVPEGLVLQRPSGEAAAGPCQVTWAATDRGST